MRRATAADLDAATETIALAFEIDPVWGPVLQRPDGATEHLRSFWRPFVEGALRYSTVWIVDDAASVAVWIPPDGTEMTDEQVSRVEAVADLHLDPRQRAAFDELWHRFELNRPQGEPHAYLSLLATHPAHRGHGIGQQLLAANLSEFADAGLPAYLESTNPINNPRYERVGFRTIGGFTAPFNEAPITTMWRPVDA